MILLLKLQIAILSEAAYNKAIVSCSSFEVTVAVMYLQIAL